MAAQPASPLAPAAAPGSFYLRLALACCRRGLCSVHVVPQIGQHDLDPSCCPDLKKRLGCIRGDGVSDRYGIGMSLYFKFLKVTTQLREPNAQRDAAPA